MGVIGKQNSSLLSALATFFLTTSNKTDNHSATGLDEQVTASIYSNWQTSLFRKCCSHRLANSVVKTVVFYAMKKQRVKDRDLAIPAVYGLLKRGRHER